MLQFKQDETEAVMILTLTELVTIGSPSYLFVFTNVTTKDIIGFVLTEEDDQSEYPERYNKFTINASEVFADKPMGEWHYRIYEQYSGSNLDPELAVGILEEGKLMLGRAAEFEYTQYDSATSYKAYNG